MAVNSTATGSIGGMKSSLDTYANQLAQLKAAYGAADSTGQTDIAAKGLQIRNQAYNDGYDLGALEDSANKLSGVAPMMNDADYGAWKQQTFSKAMTASPLPQIPTTAPGQNGGNGAFNDYYKYMTQYTKMLDTPFSFNPETDPSYQAYKTLNENEAKHATNNAFQSLSDRGIANSSIASNQANQISQDAMLRTQAMIPQLQQQAYQQRQGDLGNLFNLMNSSAQMGQYQTELPMRESEITGVYKPAGMTDLINRIINDKKGWSNPMATSTDKTKYADDAQQARDALTALGIDGEKLFGSNVGVTDALKNAGTAGRMTMANQTGIMNSIGTLANSFGTMPKGAGDLVGGLPGYSSLKPFFTGLEGKGTLSSQKAASGSGDGSMSLLDQERLSDQNTKNILNQIFATAGNMADALDFYNQHLPEWRNNSSLVDIQKIKAGIDEMFKPKVTPKPEDTRVSPQVYNTALEQAQTDKRWLADKGINDPVNSQILNEYLAFLSKQVK